MFCWNHKYYSDHLPFAQEYAGKDGEKLFYILLSEWQEHLHSTQLHYSDTIFDLLRVLSRNAVFT